MDITGGGGDAQNFHTRTGSCLSNTGFLFLLHFSSARTHSGKGRKSYKFLKRTGKRGGQKGRKVQRRVCRCGNLPNLPFPSVRSTRKDGHGQAVSEAPPYRCGKNWVRNVSWIGNRACQFRRQIRRGYGSIYQGVANARFHAHRCLSQVP